MRQGSRYGSLRFRAAILLALCGALAGGLARATATPAPNDEIRALWVLRSSLSSPASIESLVEAARTYGFNTLLVQVRGRGDAYYARALEPRADELSDQPASFDPLATVLDTAHASGLRVHAWVNVNLVSSAVTLPSSPNHIVYDHPEWLMVPRPIAAEMAAVDIASPAYLGRLARWTRTQSTEVEGLYLSPINPEAAAHVTAVVSDLVARYPLDGVHLDYVRYPDDRFDYSRDALALFRADAAPSIGEAARQELDRKALTDPLAWPDALPDQWASFRRARLSSLVMRLRTAVKSRRPGARLSAAVAPDVDEAFVRRLQDWRTWLDAGMLDAVCPMAYTPDADRFAQQVALARGLAGTRSVWAGIGAYRLTAAQTVDRIRSARQLGADGVILFSYDALADQPRSRETYLSQVSRAAFATAAGSR